MFDWPLLVAIQVAVLIVLSIVAGLITQRVARASDITRIRWGALTARAALERLRPEGEPGASIREQIEHLARRLGEVKADPIVKKQVAALVHEQFGRYFFELGDYMKALRSLNQALENDPTLTAAWHLKAGCLAYMSRGDEPGLLRLKRLQEALEAARRAKELEPKNGRRHMGEGWILDEMGNYDEAIKAYERAAGYSPDLRTEATYNIACALAKSGNLKEALTTLGSIAPAERFMEHARTDPDLTSSLGRSAEFADRFWELVGGPPSEGSMSG